MVIPFTYLKIPSKQQNVFYQKSVSFYFRFRDVRVALSVVGIILAMDSGSESSLEIDHTNANVVREEMRRKESKAWSRSGSSLPIFVPSGQLQNQVIVAAEQVRKSKRKID